jgi:hypothetical protein
MEQLIVCTERAKNRGSGGRAVDYARVERDVGERTAAVERAAHASILASLEVAAPTVVIDGRVHTRVHQGVEGRYYTLAGDVVVPRSLYRAERNGPVVDAISVRIGAVEGGWLPETVTAMAHLLQQGPSREAEETARRLGRLPYSRSSFERVGHATGQLFAAKKTEVEDALIVALEIPVKTQSVSFGIDRVSLPMEEPRPRPVGRPPKGAPKRPVRRVYRMAYCTTVTFHDEMGTALHTIRYGAVPTVAPTDLCDRLLADAVAILEHRPDLRVVLLSDGAPEMRALLDTALNEDTLGKPVCAASTSSAGRGRFNCRRAPVYELLDFWHLLEKLAAAAAVLYGEPHMKAVIGRWRVDLLNRNAAPDDILTTLRQSGQRDVRVGQKRPVHEAITYIENHREYLGYPGARRRGLPVGSGTTEATCKSLFAIRMKRSGARWKEETARDVINLRALALSDRWSPALQLTLAPLRRAVRAAA